MELFRIQIKSEDLPRRSPLLVALVARHGGGVKIMKDRRTPRGGNRNKQRDYRSDNY
jgi:hypothetical protein